LQGQEVPNVSIERCPLCSSEYWSLYQTGCEPELPRLSEEVADLDEQRLSILKMVEQGQITPEEAEMLLDALE